MSPFEVAALILSLILSAVIVVVIIRGNIADKHAPEMKKRAAEIATPLFKEIFGEDMQYDPAGRIGDKDLAQAQFAAGYNLIRGSDLVNGCYRGVPVCFSDIKLIHKEERRDPKTRNIKTEYTTLFSALWMVVEFDRELTDIPLNIEGGLSNKSIQTENVSFNKTFGVYCADRQTAFYILTPHFMERLMKTAALTRGCIHIQIFKNKVQIAVSYGGDRFELEYYKKMTKEEIEAQFRGEIGGITDVLDSIMDHERLFGPLQPAP